MGKHCLRLGNKTRKNKVLQITRRKITKRIENCLILKSLLKIIQTQVGGSSTIEEIRAKASYVKESY
jgi:hypothetical protein